MPQFDYIVGNPPYQSEKSNNAAAIGGGRLWPRFVQLSIDALKDRGSLAFIHPNAWRKSYDVLGIRSLIKENNLIYLNMNSLSSGQKTFGASTAYDWYILKKEPYCGKTMVNDFSEKEYEVDINRFSFIPNLYEYDLSKCFSLNEETEIITCCADLDHRKATETGDLLSYYSTGSDGQIRTCTFDSTKLKDKDTVLKHLVPKVIIQLTGHKLHTYNDYDAKYICGEFCCAIKIQTKEQGNKIVDWFNRNEKILNETLMWGMTREYRLFRLLKKEFYLYDIK